MEERKSNCGRSLLVAVTIIAVALQALKLGSRGLLLHRWPTAGQWGQLALVVWLLISLWEGKAWARVVAALYYAVAAVGGAVFMFLAWWRIEPPLRVVMLLITLLAAVEAAVLAFSADLRAYMSMKRGGADDRGAGDVPSPGSPGAGLG